MREFVLSDVERDGNSCLAVWYGPSRSRVREPHERAQVRAAFGPALQFCS